MRKTAEKQRIKYLDIAKGIGIILVVLGHCLGIPDWLNHFVFTVHMPLFFILSGYTYRPGSEKDLKGFFQKNVRALLFPYIITCGIILAVQTILAVIQDGDVLSVMIKWLVSGLYGSGYTCPAFFEAAHIPFTYIGAIWFLLALFFARIGLALCLRSRVPFLWVMVIFCAGLVTSERIGWFPFSIQAGMCAVLFLYIGYRMRRNELLRWDVVHPVLKLFMLCIWAYCILFCGKLYMVSNTYTDGIMDMAGGICGTFMIVYLAQGIERAGKVLRHVFTGVGRISLGILCAHMIVLDCCMPYDNAGRLADYFQISYRIPEFFLLFAGSAMVTLILYYLPWINRRLFPIRFS